MADGGQKPERAPEASDGQDTMRCLMELVREQGLKEGDRLPNIRQLSATLKVKTTTVDDALLQTQVMRFLHVLPCSGAYVRSLNDATLVDALRTTIVPALLQAVHNLFHLLDACWVLEIEMVGRAAERRRLEDLLPIRQEIEAMRRLTGIHRRLVILNAEAGSQGHLLTSWRSALSCWRSSGHWSPRRKVSGSTPWLLEESASHVEAMTLMIDSQPRPIRGAEANDALHRVEKRIWLSGSSVREQPVSR